VHVFGPSGVFPYAKGAPFIPHDAPKEKLFAMHAVLGIEQPDFRALLDLLKDERILVKVNGSERCTKQPPPYRDAIPFARRLVEEIAPLAAQRQALLVDNPRRFYRFE